MCFDKINERIKKLTWEVLAVDKIAVVALAFLVAKIWPAVLSLDWYWYLIVALVAKAYVASRWFAK
jgi:hypothetical protein